MLHRLLHPGPHATPEEWEEYRKFVKRHDLYWLGFFTLYIVALILVMCGVIRWKD